MRRAASKRRTDLAKRRLALPLRPCPTASLLQDPPSLAVPQPKTAFGRQNATFAVHFSCRQNVDN